MIRFVEIVMIAATVVVAVALYAVKYDTGNVAKGIASLNREIAEEREAISVLRAEWSLLNQPARIQELTKAHLDLVPLQSGQIRYFADIPELAPAEAMTDLVERTLSSSFDEQAAVQR